MYTKDPDIKIFYSHSPVAVEVDDNTSFAISKEGRVTISVKSVEKDPDSGIESDVLDEITVPASLIYKIMNMIKNTQKRKKMSTEEYVKVLKEKKE